MIYNKLGKTSLQVRVLKPLKFMRAIIEQYNYKDIAKINDSLIEYRNILDYQNIFASKEWLLSFLETYKSENNFLIQSINGGNYFSLSLFRDELIFTGDPFNDFNSVFTKDVINLYDFPEIVGYFLKLNYRIKWNNLFEGPLIENLEKIDQINDGITCLKIDGLPKAYDYDALVSNRIRKMYERFSDNLSFHRIFADEIRDTPAVLYNLLQMRQEKLLDRKQNEYNTSFENKFNEFIIKLTRYDSLGENLFIDYCMDKNTSIIVSSSLNFVKDKKIICYLRAHAQSKNNISYGLILDYWSNKKNLEDGIKIIDFTRGNEFYKYRLGAVEYKLKNFVTI